MHVFNWHKTNYVNLVARNRDVIGIMRVGPLFIPLREHVPRNERWEKRIFRSPRQSFFPLDFSKCEWIVNRFSRWGVVLTLLGFLLYTLTLECALVPALVWQVCPTQKDPERRGGRVRTKALKEAKGCV